MISFPMAHPTPVKTIPLELIEKLPKTDLHVHLDGSLRLETILELAEQQQRRAARDATRTGSAQAMNLGAELRLARRVPQGLRRHAARDADRGRALPRRLRARRGRRARERPLHGGPLLADAPHARAASSSRASSRRCSQGLRAAHDTLGIESNVIICGIRNISPESLARDGRARGRLQEPRRRRLRPRRRRVRPPGQAPRAAFQLVRDNNINCTIHAGEAYGPESIAQAIHVCGAHRIGHGCRLREDGDLLHYVNDHRIPLECCPSSNVQTGAVRDLASHPLKLY